MRPYSPLAKNTFVPPPQGEFCRHTLSESTLSQKHFKQCLHSGRWGFWELRTFISRDPTLFS